MFLFLHSRIGEVIICHMGTNLMKINMSEISEIHNYIVVAQLFIWSGNKLV